MAWTSTSGSGEPHLDESQGNPEQRHRRRSRLGLQSRRQRCRRRLSDPARNGTAIAGIVAAYDDNGIGIAGMAPNAKILPIKTFSSISGSGSFSQNRCGHRLRRADGRRRCGFGLRPWAPSDSFWMRSSTPTCCSWRSPATISRPGPSPGLPGLLHAPERIDRQRHQADGYSATAYGKKTVQIAAPAMNT